MKYMAALFLLLLSQTLSAEDAKVLLARIDSQRDIPDMSFELQLTSYLGDKVKETNVLWGYIKTRDDHNKTLLWFASPGSVKGRKMLMDGNTVYLLFPKTRNPIRLSPLQVLTGESSNGDVARTGFSQEYDPAFLEDSQRDGKDCWLFTLTVKESRKSSTYRMVKLWVEKSNLQPYYGEFYTTGEQPLKTIYYRNYGAVGNKMVPFIMDIADGANPLQRTEMKYLRITSKKVPDTFFRREYLETWTPEGVQ